MNDDQAMYYDKDGKATDDREKAVYSPCVIEEPDGEEREVLGLVLDPGWEPQIDFK